MRGYLLLTLITWGSCITVNYGPPPNQLMIELMLFHRRLLRYALDIHYPRVITNCDLYEMTECEPWSATIKMRRLSWLGHLMRMDPEVPARVALQEALKPAKRKRGRPPTTWTTIIQQDLVSLNISTKLNNNQSAIEELESLCGDRKEWMARCRMRGNPRAKTLDRGEMSCQVESLDRG